ncbi:MAG: hypothetical protein KGM97_04945 [Alphaproteobacteria bacterium]|nr:hypothetical protein [Alphaproteobacteria bacterium]MDE2630321.1 hypothetical protein [Alphaproteobacteria bacterium]
MEILNKIDLLESGARAGLLARAASRPEAPAAVSALTGEGLGSLLKRLEAVLTGGNIRLRLALSPSDGEGLAWAYRHARVLARDDNGGGEIVLTLSANPQEAEKLGSRFTGKISVEQGVEADI